MPVPLADVLEANALVSLEEAKTFAGLLRDTNANDLTVDEQRLVEAINRVSAFVESDVRPMARATETLYLPAPRAPVLKLARIPIVVGEPVELAINDVAHTVWRSDADGARRDHAVLVHRSNPNSPWTPDGLWLRGMGGPRGGHWLYCGCGCQGAHGGYSDPEPLRLTYTGGFDCLPADGSRNKLPGDMRVAVLEAVRAWYRNEQQGTTDVVSLGQPGGGPTFETPRWLPYSAQQIFARHRPVSTVLG